MSDEPTFDLTVPGLTEDDIAIFVNGGYGDAINNAARAKLAEIDAERAAAVKATERRTFAVYECDAEDNRRSVFASDLAVGDRVEGRTVSDPMDADGYVWFNDGGTGWQYGPGSLVLLDGEGS